LNYEDPFPRLVNWDIRECDIMKVDITEFRVYMVNLSTKLS
jgi:hypothetical protein